MASVGALTLIFPLIFMVMLRLHTEDHHKVPQHFVWVGGCGGGQQQT